jgi:hypothetical protein
VIDPANLPWAVIVVAVALAVLSTSFAAARPARALSSRRPHDAARAGRAARRGAGVGPVPERQRSGLPASNCRRDPVIEEMSALPSGTPAPNTVITEDAVAALGLPTTLDGWLVNATRRLSSGQVDAARLLALGADMTIETGSSAPGSPTINNWATIAGVALALAVLAMTIGVVRSETAGGLRTLSATGDERHPPDDHCCDRRLPRPARGPARDRCGVRRRHRLRRRQRERVERARERAARRPRRRPHRDAARGRSRRLPPRRARAALDRQATRLITLPWSRCCSAVAPRRGRRVGPSGPRRPVAGAAGDRSDARDELGEAEGLDDLVIGSR